MPDYQLIRSKRKTLSLQINYDAQLIVRSPLRLSIKKIESFISEKQNWISKKQAQIASKTTKKSSYEVNDEYLFLGKSYPLKHTKTGNPLSFDGKHFVLNTKYLGVKAFHWFYQKEFIKTAMPLLEKFGKKHNLAYQKVRFKAQKTRWGSCSASNNISLNYLLMMAPLTVIEMVIAHELAHIQHKNHSKDFYSLLKKMLPWDAVLCCF
ncbi:MAG: M48 family metallopeptidase [Candidatus Thioglobus sp.]|nr:MAG: M48 family metallopeptidase [Candidatus Thioglobus sp.]